MTDVGRRGVAGIPILELAAFPALLVFVFTIPWEDSLLLPGVGTVGRTAGLLAFAVGLGSIVRRDGLTVRRPAAYLVWFALFGLWTTLSVLWTPDRSRGTEYAITLVQLVMMAWLMWQLCRTAGDRAAVMQAYVLGSLVSVVNTIAQYAAGATFMGAGQERYAAAGFNPNYLASTLSLTLPMAWFLATTSRSRLLAVVDFLAIPAIVVAIFLTGSRGGFITAALALTVMPLTYARLGPRTQVAVVAGSLALGLGAYVFAPAFEQHLPTGIQRFVEIPEQLQSGDLTGRGAIWSSAVDLFRDNPVIGVGAGGFPEAIEPYLGYSHTAHNAFLNVATQGGAVALVLFCAALATVAMPFVLDLGGDRVVYLVLLATVLLILVPSTLENGKETWLVLSLAASRSAFVLGRALPAGRVARWTA